MKKVLSIFSIIAGVLVLLGVAAPMIMAVLFNLKDAASIAIIGAADGPTAIMLVGTLGACSVIVEILIGVLLIAIGIWGLRRIKKQD